MKQILIYLLISTLTTTLFAQEDNNSNKPLKAFQFDLGVSQFKENNLHSKRFNGIAYNFKYSLQWEKQNFSELNFSLGNSHLKTNIENGFSSINTSIQINYQYLFNTLKQNRWQLHTGGGLSLNYNVAYLWVWDDSHLYWANYLGFHFIQRGVFKVSESKHLVGCFAITPLMLLSRPDKQRDYKIDDFSFGGVLRNMHYSPEFRFIAQSMAIDFNIEYQYNRNKKIEPFISYSFQYLNLGTSYSNERQQILHSIGLKWLL